MNAKHITELCKHSRRIDFYQATPSLIVTVPDHLCHRDCVNEIAGVEVSRTPVAHAMSDRHTARLEQLPPPGAMVSVYWVHPGEWCHQVRVYLRDSETSEEFTERLRKMSSVGLPPHFVGGSKTSQAPLPLADHRYGLQAPSQTLQRHTE